MKKNSNYILFLAIGVANAIVLYLANIFFPTYVVLGNNALSPLLATIVTGFLLALVTSLPPPLMKAVGLKIKNELYLAVVYFIFNVVGLWILARGANYVGFGVSSYLVVLILGFVLNMVQYGVWKMVAEKK